MAGIRDFEVMRSFIRMCNDGWQQGWHERNGGNLTYRLRDSEIAQFEPFFRRDRGWVPMGVTAENLSGAYFIATGSGKFLRNADIAPEDNLCIVEINKAADAWRILWGLEQGGRPTSELPTHFLNHSVRTAATKGQSRVIYHAHTPAVIALTYILPLSARDFTRALWQSATECPVVFPQGVGVVDWMVPGGTEIAKASAELMKLYDAVIWAHHGIFCAGPDFDLSFGLMHTIEKAADIYLRILGSGQRIRQTISDNNLRDLAAAFGITLNEEFLD